MWRSLYLWIVCSCFLLVGCEPDTTTDQADVLASMEGHQLHRAEVEQLIKDKNELYNQYQTAREEAQRLDTIRHNLEQHLGRKIEHKKEQER